MRLLLEASDFRLTYYLFRSDLPLSINSFLLLSIGTKASRFESMDQNDLSVEVIMILTLGLSI